MLVCAVLEGVALDSLPHLREGSETGVPRVPGRYPDFVHRFELPSSLSDSGLWLLL